MLGDDALAGYLRGEAMAFRVFASIFSTQSNFDWLVEMAAKGLFDEVPVEGDDPAVRTALVKVHAACSTPLDASILASEHLRLFVGLPRPLAPVWESGYFNDRGLTFRQQALEVRACYRRFGLENACKNREPDDSIELEFYFLAALAEKASDALGSGDGERAEYFLAEHNGFLSAHLLCWLGSWAVLVARHGREPLYPALAQLASVLLDAVGTRFCCAPQVRPLRRI